MQAFIEDKDLGRLLVLMPHRSGQISDPTAALIHSLERSGACVAKLPGMSDIGLARCLLAGGAQKLIVQNSDKWEVVLWLDSDMYTDREVLFRQLAHLHEMTNLAPRPTLGVAVSGIACKRLDSQALAGARKYDTRPVRLTDDSIIVPGYTGMACLMITVPAFMNSCQNSPQCENDAGDLYPAIVKTGPAYHTSRDILKGEKGGPKTSRTFLVWRGEDWNYCDWQWQHGNGVWFDPSCPWGHLGESMALPVPTPVPLLLERELEEFGLSPTEMIPETLR